MNDVADDVVLGKDVKLGRYINLYGCQIGDYTKIGPFVEVQKGVSIGEKCKISSHTFICEGVTIGNGCFIGHGVAFINDKYPRSLTPDGGLETDDDWMDRMLITIIKDVVSIGSNATIMGGITIGKGAIIGAGSVVTKNVQENEVWAGNPAKKIKEL